MSPTIRSLIRRESGLLVVILLVASAVGCFADTYSDVGTVYLTGTITDVEDQQTCDRFGCHMGSTWSLAMTFLAPQWNAPDSNYLITTLFINCVGGPPCFIGYQASSDFGWGPYGFDVLSVDIEDGQVADALVACGGYSIEWGRDNRWSYVDGFSGTTTGNVTTTPDPVTLLTFATGVSLICLWRKIPRVAR